MTEQADAFPPVQYKDWLHTSSLVFVLDTGSYICSISLKLETFLLQRNCSIVSTHYIVYFYSLFMMSHARASMQKKWDLGDKAMPKIVRVFGDFAEKFRVGRSGKNTITWKNLGF